MTISGPSIPIPMNDPNGKPRAVIPCQIACSSKAHRSTVSGLVHYPLLCPRYRQGQCLPSHPRSLRLATTGRSVEVLGLVQAVVCTSSYSGGLHLYFPFDTSRRHGRSPWRSPHCWKTVASN
jgi:hypothetical protein